MTNPTSPGEATRRISAVAAILGFIPYKTVQAKAEKFNHPGTFPLDLPRWCIRLHGKPGSVVLDPFAGAGTTLLAAQAEGAHGIGIEIDPTYVGDSAGPSGRRGGSGVTSPRVALFKTCLVDLHRRLDVPRPAGPGFEANWRRPPAICERFAQGVDVWSEDCLAV